MFSCPNTDIILLEVVWFQIFLQVVNTICQYYELTSALSTARWQQAANTARPSWKYHSASSLHTLCNILDKQGESV